MGVNARADYESRFTAARSHAQWMSAIAAVTAGEVPVVSKAAATAIASDAAGIRSDP